MNILSPLSIWYHQYCSIPWAPLMIQSSSTRVASLDIDNSSNYLPDLDSLSRLLPFSCLSGQNLLVWPSFLQWWCLIEDIFPPFRVLDFDFLLPSDFTWRRPTPCFKAISNTKHLNIKLLFQLLRVQSNLNLLKRDSLSSIQQGFLEIITRLRQRTQQQKCLIFIINLRISNL